jgi:hypothetical protein
MASTCRGLAQLLQALANTCRGLAQLLQALASTCRGQNNNITVANNCIKSVWTTLAVVKLSDITKHIMCNCHYIKIST